MASKPKIIMKRALRGLYAGRHIQFGNKISEDGGNKSRRSWKPNRQRRYLFSLGLDQSIQLDITTHALRCIDRAGGLDEYLLKMPERKLHTEKLLQLKRAITGSYKKVGDSLVPPDLERKVKAVMEWSFQEKYKKEEESDDEGSDVPQEVSAPTADDDYLNEMFSKFSIAQGQVVDDHPQAASMGRMGGFFPEASKARSPSGSETRPGPTEFPETLFSDVV